jgi:hypothetical protein
LLGNYLRILMRLYGCKNKYGQWFVTKERNSWNMPTLLRWSTIFGERRLWNCSLTNMEKYMIKKKKQAQQKQQFVVKKLQTHEKL